MTDFRIIKRPPNDKNLLFQPDSLLTIRSTTSFQNSSLLASPPIGRPKYINGSEPTRQSENISILIQTYYRVSVNLHFLLVSYQF